ncbi:unnamed protein product [Pedinophyceae sp. YPF-701]|nr:unnamed protein product [Pedinophyceae sp. YPF-701]
METLDLSWMSALWHRTEREIKLRGLTLACNAPLGLGLVKAFNIWTAMNLAIHGLLPSTLQSCFGSSAMLGGCAGEGGLMHGACIDTSSILPGMTVGERLAILDRVWPMRCGTDVFALLWMLLTPMLFSGSIALPLLLGTLLPGSSWAARRDDVWKRRGTVLFGQQIIRVLGNTYIMISRPQDSAFLHSSALTISFLTALEVDTGDKFNDLATPPLPITVARLTTPICFALAALFEIVVYGAPLARIQLYVTATILFVVTYVLTAVWMKAPDRNELSGEHRTGGWRAVSILLNVLATWAAVVLAMWAFAWRAARHDSPASVPPFYMLVAALILLCALQHVGRIMAESRARIVRNILPDQVAAHVLDKVTARSGAGASGTSTTHGARGAPVSLTPKVSEMWSASDGASWHSKPPANEPAYKPVKAAQGKRAPTRQRVQFAVDDISLEVRGRSRAGQRRSFHQPGGEPGAGSAGVQRPAAKSTSEVDDGLRQRSVTMDGNAGRSSGRSRSERKRELRKQAAELEQLAMRKAAPRLFDKHDGSDALKGMVRRWYAPRSLQGPHDPPPCLTSFDDVTVVFSTVMGWDESPTGDADDASKLRSLHTCFSRLDGLVQGLGIYKYETVSDTYIAIISPPASGADAQAATALAFATSIFFAASSVPRPGCEHEEERISQDGAESYNRLSCRVGIHRGPISGAVLGNLRPLFTVIGTTVNIASRMDSSCPRGCIKMTEAVFDELHPELQSLCSHSEEYVKGIGLMPTWTLPVLTSDDTAPVSGVRSLSTRVSKASADGDSFGPNIFKVVDP